MAPRALAARIAEMQGVLAFLVEVGVRLIEHQHRGIAEEGARKRDALRLAKREAGAARAERRVIAVRQAGDHVMRTGDLRGGDDGGVDRDAVGGVARLEAADVVGDGAASRCRSCGK